MFEITLDTSAELDFDEIFRWYQEQREGLGYEFLMSFESSLNLLAENPFAFFNVTKTVRRIAVKRFPYNVYYSVVDKTLTIHLIMHQHKNPQEWQMR